MQPSVSPHWLAARTLMAGSLALAAAHVEGPAGSWDKASIVVRTNRLKITSREGAELLVSTDVQRVERLSRTTWQVVLAGGDTYQVVRQAGGCGCARGGG